MLVTSVLLALLLERVVVEAQTTASAPPLPGAALLMPPPPPPPKLVAGLRSLLNDVPGCDSPCLERAEDWFEQAERWGATNVASMVRLSLQDNFVVSLTLSANGQAEIHRRLSTVKTTLVPHDEV